MSEQKWNPPERPTNNPNQYPLEKMRGTTSNSVPQNEDAERQVLGMMMVESGVISEVSEIVEKDDFFDSFRRRVYETILHLWQQGVDVDLPTVTDSVRRRHEGKIPQGFEVDLTDMTTEVAASTNAPYWATLVKEKSMLRHLREVGYWLTGETKGEGEADPLDIHETLLAKTHTLTAGIHGDRLQSGADVLDQSMERIVKSVDSPDGITGIPCGFRRLDGMTGGPERGELLYLAARPSMGKTAMAVSMALNQMRGPYDHDPYNVAFFSEEMGAPQLGNRFLSCDARVNLHSLRQQNDPESMLTRVAESRQRLAQAPFWIDDTPGMTVEHIRAKAHEIKTQHGLDVMYVDYLQLLNPPDASAPREQQVSAISNKLAKVAGDLNVLTVGLSQLNREVEHRSDKRPQLADLRRSGSLEQDADHVWFIYRAERYGVMVDEAGKSTEGRAEILNRKQRNGPVGNVELAFVKEYGRFENLLSDKGRHPAERGPGEEDDAPF